LLANPANTTGEKSFSISKGKLADKAGLIAFATVINKMVYPSGEDFAAKLVPIFVPAPGLFSTINC
jgi:hypothetical protein